MENYQNQYNPSSTKFQSCGEEAYKDACDKASQAAQIGKRSPNFLLTSVRNTFSRIVATIDRKNSDYAGDAAPFKNFESCQRAGISVQAGIFVRFLDKVTRLENLLDGNRQTKVADESVDDTIDDAIGYLACLKARREYEKQPKDAGSIQTIGTNSFYTESRY